MPLPVHDIGAQESLTRFAERIFASMPRSDQRRRAGAYLHGLLATPGRKSVNKIAAQTADGPVAPHSMRQFVNDSSWEWSPVRRELAHWVAERTAARAWTLGIAVLAKRGVHSAGVHRRFVPSVGRSVNCQVAVGLFLTGDTDAVPVDWSLLLPDSWASDPHRRSRARIPPEAVRPLEHEAVALLDAQPDAWGFNSLPVVADLSACGHALHLVRGLVRRRREYVVGLAHPPAAPPDGPRPPGAAAEGHLPDVLPGRQRHFAAPETARSLSAPTWTSNMTRLRTADLRALAGLDRHTRRAVRRLEEGFGLLDFEGRSYPGWHHHMTMVSAAFAFSRLGLRAGRPPTAVRDGCTAGT
ncbi:IS701 family transposase [Streptomyces sp. NPDC003860]